MSTAKTYAERLMEILLPKGGFVILHEAYSDASKSGPKQPCHFFSVASFLFDSNASVELNREWEQILRPHVGHLPEKKRYFHMTDLFERRMGTPYEHFNEAMQLDLQRQLIDSAHRHVRCGIVASVCRDEYERTLAVFPEESRRCLGSPFIMLNLWCMEQLVGHLNSSSTTGEIAFFFESGDPEQKDLCSFLNLVSTDSRLAERYRYAGHSFIPKHKHHALGAADMLAWEYRNGAQEYFQAQDREKFKMREIFNVLFQQPVYGLHFHPRHIQIREMLLLTKP